METTRAARLLLLLLGQQALLASRRWNRPGAQIGASMRAGALAARSISIGLVSVWLLSGLLGTLEPPLEPTHHAHEQPGAPRDLGDPASHGSMAMYGIQRAPMDPHAASILAGTHQQEKTKTRRCLLLAGMLLAPSLRPPLPAIVEAGFLS